MQYGSFGVIPVLCACALIRRRSSEALVLGVGGAAAWVCAKAVKPVVGRDRPAALLGDVRRRGKEKENDQGFPSGHAAVAAALTMVAWPQSGLRWRLASALLALFVPVARCYVGAHLPMDVLGGAAVGLTIGSSVNLAFGDR